MIRVFRYNEATSSCSRGGADLLGSPDDGEDVVWVDLEAPTAEEEERVFGQYFHVHALTLEDVTRPRRLPDQPPHLPKVEEFPGYLFVVVNPLRPDAARALLDGEGDHLRLASQLSAVLTRHMLITHHEEPLAAVKELHANLHKHEAQACRGPDYLFHLILDVMVDEYAPLLDEVDVTVDRIEDEVFQRPSQVLLSRLLALKRNVIALRKTVVHEREVLARLSRGEFGLIEQRETAYYRNVYDHLLRFTDLLEASREMIADLLQTHLAAQANKLNEIMKVLTMISTTILPMALIAGVYGMNFEQGVWPDYKNSPYGFPVALAMMLASGALAFAFFRWRRWI